MNSNPFQTLLRCLIKRSSPVRRQRQHERQTHSDTAQYPTGVSVNVSPNWVGGALKTDDRKRSTKMMRRYYSSSKKKQKLKTMPAYPLDETIERFLRTCKPLLTSDEFCETMTCARNFAAGEGRELQELLQQAAMCEKNWQAHRYTSYRYLQNRKSLTGHSSPALTYPPEIFRSIDQLIVYTAKVIFGLVKFREMVRNDEIPVKKFGNLEMDNSQYGLIFGSNRQPRAKEDKVLLNRNTHHVIVMFRNHFYKLPVYDRRYQPLHYSIIATALKKIIETEKEDACSFGALTSLDRDRWFHAYRRLQLVPGNCLNLAAIESALFVVCIDEHVPIDCATKWNTNCLQLMHGGGMLDNAGNRWMDKTLQFVVNQNGQSGLVFEQSRTEEHPIIAMSEYVLDNLDEDLFFDNASQDNYPSMKKLELRNDGCLERYMSKAHKHVDQINQDLDIKVLYYNEYGKTLIEENGLNPDSFIQMVLQYVYYRMHGMVGAQQERVHLRIFEGGRAETFRSCSALSTEFVHLMMDPHASAKKKIAALNKAVKRHSLHKMFAMRGRSVDNHFLGLRAMAIENNMPIPEFFNSVGYNKSRRFRLDTSEVSSEFVLLMCYAPSDEKGYSVCYNIRAEDIIFSVGAWRKSKKTNACEFVKKLADALDELRELIMCILPPKGSKRRMPC